MDILLACISYVYHASVYFFYFWGYNNRPRACDGHTCTLSCDTCIYVIQSLDTPILAEDMNMKEEQLREEARIYRKEAKRPLSSNQKKMNDAAEQICLENPSMLRKRSDLIEAARSRIIEEGFQFKKGKSRSKKLLTTSEPRSKRIKLTQQVRQIRMKNVEEDIGDIKDQISFKEKHRCAAEAIRDYKKYDEITEELTRLKHKRRELEEELKALKSKEKQSKRYKDRINSQRSNSSTEAGVSDTDNSS